MNADTLARDFYKEIPNIPWTDFRNVGMDEPYYDYNYCGSGLYIIRDRITEGMWFIEAGSPKEAFEVFRESHNIIGCSVDDSAE